MGAINFMCQGAGKSAKEVFYKLKDEYRYHFGHSGYTGTIAEKNSFVMIPLPDGEDPREYADKLIYDGDPTVSDKWGACGCIAIPNSDEYLFFGMASC